MNEILIIASLLAHGFLLSRSLRFGVYFTTLILPLYVVRTHIGLIPTTLLELNILLLFGWWAVVQIANRQLPIIKYIARYALRVTRFYDVWFWIILFWLAVATLSMIVSPNLREAAGTWKAYFVEPFLFLIVFVDVMSRPSVVGAQNFVPLLIRNTRTIFHALIASGTAVAIIAIIQKFTGWWIANPFWQAGATRRVTSVFPFPNAVGLYLAPVTIIALALAVSHLPSFRELVSSMKSHYHNTLYIILYTLASSAMLLAILFSRSRGALLGVGAGILFLAFIHKGRRLWYWTGAGIVALLIVLTPLKHTFFDLLQSNPASFSEGDSNSIRIEMWNESLRFLKDHPIFGAGLSGYQQEIEPYHSNPAVEIYKYPHNVLLNFWTEMGLIGLVVFLLVIFRFYQILLRSRAIIQKTADKKQLTNNNPDSCLLFTVNCLLAAMTALLVHGMVDVPYFKNDLSLFFWILIGISCILNSSNSSREAYGAGTIPQKKLPV